MVNKIHDFFASDEGKKIYATIERAIFEHNMLEAIKRGVLVGFSGGADSVMLLSFLFEMRNRGEDFQLLACHINHMIRGDEADRDESFSRKFADSLGIPFISYQIDVPSIAKAQSKGLEEAARNVRYSKFTEIMQGRDDIGSICVAHNATDNAETVLFNILRGAGTRGTAGIPPVRDNILRPLIYLPKEEITSSLLGHGISFVTDSTNLEDDYTRNFIRNHVLKSMSEITPGVEKSFTRLSRNLRCDDDYLSGVASDFLSSADNIKTKDLASLHKSILCRVLSKMAEKYSVTLENVHIESIGNLLSEDNFEVSLPGGIRFVSERGISYMTDRINEDKSYNFPIVFGENKIPEYNATVLVTDGKINKFSLNVYKKSIQADISSAIIVGRLFLRSKQDGDSVFYGGITHKLKKLFNDKKIPKSKRSLIPVLCDEKGVVWVPGFGVRDDCPDDKKPLYATIAIDNSETECNEFYI